MEQENFEYEILCKAWSKNITKEEVIELATKLFGSNIFDLTNNQQELLKEKLDNLTCQKEVSKIEREHIASGQID